MQEFTHRSGAHTSTPVMFPRFVCGATHISGLAMFMADAKYNHDSDDQLDWNKLTGLDFSPLDPGNWSNSAMIGWRYLPDGNQFQIGLYCHNERGTRLMPEDNGSITNVKQGQPFSFKIGHNGKQWFLEFNQGDVSKRHHAFAPTTLPKWFGKPLARRIWPWFGGNKPAPTIVKLFLTKY